MHKAVFKTKANHHKGFSLIEMVVVMVILVILMGGVAFYLGGSGKSKPGERIHTPKAKANEVVCRNNLSQIRQALTMAQTANEEEKFPTSLTELREIPTEMRACAVGSEPYEYDSTTGRVRCVHPGHENF